MNKFKQTLKDKGYTHHQLAKRWGFKHTNIFKIAKNPKQMHLDAVEGLPENWEGQQYLADKKL